MKKCVLVFSFFTLFISYYSIAQENYPSPIRSGKEPVVSCKFEPTWQSLSQYKTPEWFRNVKFDIILCTTTMGVPMGNVCLKSIGKNKDNAKIKNIEVLGSQEKLFWKQYSDSLVIVKPKIIPNDIAVVSKISEILKQAYC